MDALKEILVRLDPEDVLETVDSLYLSSNIYPNTQVWKYLLTNHFPEFPDYNDPKGQYIALTNDRFVELETFLYINQIPRQKVIDSDGYERNIIKFRDNKAYHKFQGFNDRWNGRFVPFKVHGLNPPNGSVFWLIVILSNVSLKVYPFYDKRSAAKRYVTDNHHIILMNLVTEFTEEQNFPLEFEGMAYGDITKTPEFNKYLITREIHSPLTEESMYQYFITNNFFKFYHREQGHVEVYIHRVVLET
jgi:hypothetical protein